MGLFPHAPLVMASRRAGVRDERLLRAMATLDRSRFVPEDFRFMAELDRPIPIPNQQVTSQPSLVAKMVEALGLRGDERVLEVGTGLGYQCALLSKLAAKVVTIERFADLAEGARHNLQRANIHNVEVILGDGTLGHPLLAPYDAIIVAAAAPEVARPLIEQLREDGLLVQPIGPGGDEIVTVFQKRGGELIEREALVGAYFVPLVSGEGSRDETS